MSERADAKQLRSFGLIVGGVFAGIGLWPPLVRQDDARVWALAVAVALVFPAVTRPVLLRPAHRAWMALADVLGWINTRLLLGLVFYGLVAPMGIAMRLAGRDPMRRRFERHLESYRVRREPRPGLHMLRQF